MFRWMHQRAYDEDMIIITILKIERFICSGPGAEVQP